MNEHSGNPIQEWLSSLVRDSPLSRPVATLTDGKSASPADVEAVLDRLETPERHTSHALCASARLVSGPPLSPEQRARAVAALRLLAAPRLPDGTLRSLKTYSWFGCLAAAASGAAALVCEAVILSVSWAFGADVLMLGLVALAVGAIPASALVGFLDDQRAWFAIRRAAITALGKMRALDAAAPVAAAALELDGPIRRAGEESLGTMLPAMTRESIEVLDPQVVPLLCRCLLRYTGLDTQSRATIPDLADGVLCALDQVGTGLSVPSVRQVAERCREPRIQERARRLLPVLEARRERERQATTLLRPAEAPVGDMLLRPASAGPDAPPEQLLRPADPG